MFLLALLFGTVIGSFLNVCIYRIPRHEEIVYTPSHCMACGQPIKWYDLVPVISFLHLRGRCRQCGTTLSKQYPLVEFINGLAYMGLYLIYGLTLQWVIAASLFSALLVIAVIDYYHMIIPNGMVIYLAITHILYVVVVSHHYTKSIAGFVVITGVMMAIYLLSRGNLGLGDVKLMAVCGILLGWYNSLLALSIGAVLGSVIGLTLIGMKRASFKQAIPFGPFLCTGIMIAFLYGDDLVTWYLQFIL